MARLRPLLALLALPLARAAITVYQAPGQAAFATGSGSAAASAYTGAAAYNPTTLVAPPVPSPLSPGGDFVGFSIEMSVSNQVLGKNATHIQVPFLNLMANIQQRAGAVRVRVGGNSQESATLVPAASIPDGKILQKNLTGVTGTTQTPPLEYSDELFYMMSNISSLVNVNWFLGIPWFVTQPFDLAIVGAAERILGGRVIGYQVCAAFFGLFFFPCYTISFRVMLSPGECGGGGGRGERTEGVDDGAGTRTCGGRWEVGGARWGRRPGARFRFRFSFGGLGERARLVGVQPGRACSWDGVDGAMVMSGAIVGEDVRDGVGVEVELVCVYNGQLALSASVSASHTGGKLVVHRGTSASGTSSSSVLVSPPTLRHRILPWAASRVSARLRDETWTGAQAQAYLVI
ncbi:hypothetical protein B0H13DRAFT_2666945 [Mycena leptocephala]|nr:hypothetical protein B0H13DRAFT_2666945 [Mycena leptocephala]